MCNFQIERNDGYDVLVFVSQDLFCLTKWEREKEKEKEAVLSQRVRSLGQGQVTDLKRANDVRAGGSEEAERPIEYLKYLLYDDDDDDDDTYYRRTCGHFTHILYRIT